MNAPYEGKFRVSQAYKGASHAGLDLVGVTSKLIHSTVCGKVIRAGWENPTNHAQGWGQRVVIRKNGTDEYYYFGHLSEVYAKAGDTVDTTTVIGAEGSTGRSTGSHCHYECRLCDSKNRFVDISAISGIPNVRGTYDAGGTCCPYTAPSVTTKRGCKGDSVRWLQWQLQRLGYDIGSCGVDGIFGLKTHAAVLKFQASAGIVVDGLVGPATRAKLLDR